MMPTDPTPPSIDDLRDVLVWAQGRVSGLSDGSPADVSEVIDGLIARLSARRSTKVAPDQVEADRVVGSIHGSGTISAGGDIVAGDKVSLALGTPSLTEPEALGHYLTRVRESADVPPLDGLQVISTGTVIHLKDVYVVPHVAERVAVGQDRDGREHRLLLNEIDSTQIAIVGNWEVVPMLASEFIARFDRAVVTGDVGTTALSRVVAREYAETALNVNRISEEPAQTDGGDRTIPVNVNLLEFSESRWFGRTAESLWNFFDSTIAIIPLAGSAVRRQLLAGRAVTIFTGLHDIGDVRRYSDVLAAVADWVQAFPSARHLVFDRIIAGEAAERLRAFRFHHSRIEPFTGEQIGEFITRWQTVLHAARIVNADMPPHRHVLHKSDIRDLTSNPRILTYAMQVSDSWSPQMHDRAYILNEVLRRLLSAWIQKIDRSITVHVIEVILCELALVAVATQRHRVSEPEALATVRRHLGCDWNTAAAILDGIADETGVCRRDGDAYVFPERELRECMAARHLSRSDDLGGRLRQLVSDGSRIVWTRVAAWATYFAGTEKGLMAISALVSPAGLHDMETGADRGYWNCVLCSGECLVGLRLPIHDGRPERVHIVQRVTQALEHACVAEGLQTHDRIDAANLLGQIGDERPGVFSMEPEWVCISPNDVLVNAWSADGSSARERIVLDYEWWIGRYPVTQEQYAHFIKARADQVAPMGVEEYHWFDRQCPAKLRNHPVVLVSWYDALAYCGWLEQELRRNWPFPETYCLRLPTDAEWSLAARGGAGSTASNPHPARRFPWGDEPIDEFANLPSLLPGMGRTTPVGVFPMSRSPFGVEDLAGNVSEWLNTSWGSDDEDRPGFGGAYSSTDGREALGAPGFRILRGGSWLFDEGLANCACRLSPHAGFPDCGFRVVVAPRLV